MEKKIVSSDFQQSSLLYKHLVQWFNIQIKFCFAGWVVGL